MQHSDHVRLIRDGVGGGTTWAELGSGTGAFTLALADLLGPEGTIYSVDRDEGALRQQALALRRRFPGVTLHQHAADFTQPLELPAVDGLVMANSLHFVRDKLAVLARIIGYLREGSRFILVEYDSDRGNPWVPFPISFETWGSFASQAGLVDTRRIGTVPSRFLGSIYAALSLRP
jgi:ubiquinone/menaquinone biosynthesis C-methylase UbiE